MGSGGHVQSIGELGLEEKYEEESLEDRSSSSSGFATVVVENFKASAVRGGAWEEEGMST